MEGRFAEELYAESLQLSKLELRSTGVDDQEDKSNDRVSRWSYSREGSFCTGGVQQSALAGYSWGVVRGVSSAFSRLPYQLKERLIETLEKRNQFQGLYESLHSLSTTDALRLFNEEIKAQETFEQSEQAQVLQEQPSPGSRLTNYRGQLESLIRDSPAIDIHLPKPE